MDVKGSVFGQERARPLRSCGISQGEFRFEVEILLLEQWKEKEFKEQINLIGVEDIFCPKEIIEKLVTGKMIAVFRHSSVFSYVMKQRVTKSWYLFHPNEELFHGFEEHDITLLHKVVQSNNKVVTDPLSRRCQIIYTG